MKSITGLVEVAKNVEVTGNTNNIKMATEAVYLSGPSTINGMEAVMHSKPSKLDGLTSYKSHIMQFDNTSFVLFLIFNRPPEVLKWLDHFITDKQHQCNK